MLAIKKSKNKTGLIIILGAHVALLILYFAIFGRALKQNENHAGILISLPKVIHDPASVADLGNYTYLARNSNAFIEYIRNEGFVHEEQMGSTHIFTKDGARYYSDSRMYSSYFMIFSYPSKG